MSTASPAQPPGPGSRAVWVALILLTATLIASAAGLLAFAGGAKVPTAVLTGGGAYAGAVLLLLALYAFITGGK